jgi:hypothetical protein
MASLKKIAVAVTAGVWTSALGSAVALAFVLNRAPEPRVPPEPLTAHASVGHLLGAAVPGDRFSDMRATPLPIALHFGQALASRTAPAHVDIEHMRCDDWRELTMGSGHVRVCE